MKHYATTARLYRVLFPSRKHATIVARDEHEALRELLGYNNTLDMTNAQIALVPPNQSLTVCYLGDASDEIYHDFLGISRDLKPGFVTSLDEDNDLTVSADAAVWAAAFDEDMPCVICSTINS